MEQTQLLRRVFIATEPFSEAAEEIQDLETLARLSIFYFFIFFNCETNDERRIFGHLTLLSVVLAACQGGLVLD